MALANGPDQAAVLIQARARGLLARAVVVHGARAEYEQIVREINLAAPSGPPTRPEWRRANVLCCPTYGATKDSAEQAGERDLEDERRQVELELEWIRNAMRSRLEHIRVAHSHA